MKRKQQLPVPAQIALAVVGLILVMALSWFFVVSPQRSKAASLAKEIEATEAQIALQMQQATAAKILPPIETGDLFRLAKAMPDQEDMPGVLLELNRIAEDTGISFESITRKQPIEVGGYRALPIDLVFEGNFYELSDFLFRMRSLVSVVDGQLQAGGRLFAVDQLSFAEGTGHFPQIQATLTVVAFIYGTAAQAAAAAAAPPAAAGTTTAPTTTTPTTTTPSPNTPPAAPAGATAAPAP